MRPGDMETWRRDETNGISGVDGLGVGGLGWEWRRRAERAAGGGDGRRGERRMERVRSG